MARPSSRSWLWVVLWATACQPSDDVKVGAATLPEADGVEEAPQGTTVVVPKAGEGKPDIPKELSGKVRVAADRDATWSEVHVVMEQVTAAGGEPVLLVSKNRKIHALPAVAAPEGVGIVLYATGDGKACVSPPGVEEAKCVARPDGKHIDRAFVRGLVREAVKEYNLERVFVTVDGSLSWADAVRAVDGARTCCEGKTITVSLDAP